MLDLEIEEKDAKYAADDSINMATSAAERRAIFDTAIARMREDNGLPPLAQSNWSDGKQPV